MHRNEVPSSSGHFGAKRQRRYPSARRLASGGRLKSWPQCSLPTQIGPLPFRDPLREKVSMGPEDPHLPEAIKLRMAQRGLTRRDLERVLGSESRGSEILNRKRPLTIAMIRRLHQKLGIPADSVPGGPSCRMRPRRSRGHVLAGHLREGRRAGAPACGVVAGEVVSPAGKWTASVHARCWIGTHQVHAEPAKSPPMCRKPNTAHLLPVRVPLTSESPPARPPAVSFFKFRISSSCSGATRPASRSACRIGLSSASAALKILAAAS